jgi:hypothetical protein
MGYAELINEDGHIIRLGETTMPSCINCNEIPDIDDVVRIVDISPIRWKCIKCGCVSDFPKP